MSNNSSTKPVVRETLADRASTIAKDLHEVRDATRRVASDSAEVLRETAREYLDEGRARARHVGENVQSKVQQQPVKALLVAAGLGFILGAFWTRR